MKIQKFREIEKMIFRYAYYTPPHPWGKGVQFSHLLHSIKLLSYQLLI